MIWLTIHEMENMLGVVVEGVLVGLLEQCIYIWLGSPLCIYSNQIESHINKLTSVLCLFLLSNIPTYLIHPIKSSFSARATFANHNLSSHLPSYIGSHSHPHMRLSERNHNAYSKQDFFPFQLGWTGKVDLLDKGAISLVGLTSSLLLGDPLLEWW